MTRIFDCHFHIEKGFDGYNIEAEKFNVIFNSIESYDKHQHLVPDGSVISLILDIDRHSRVQDLVKTDRRIRSLKVHCRIQKLKAEDHVQIHEHISAFPSHINVIYDAFYYGPEMEFQPNLTELIQLIRKNPERNFIVAHSGGHKALDYLLHLRSFNNVYYDLSLSLAYLQGTSAELDLIHLIKMTLKDKLIFGTDFPHIESTKQLKECIKIIENLELGIEVRNKIMFDNSLKLFNL